VSDDERQRGTGPNQSSNGIVKYVVVPLEAVDAGLGGLGG